MTIREMRASQAIAAKDASGPVNDLPDLRDSEPDGGVDHVGGTLTRSLGDVPLDLIKERPAHLHVHGFQIDPCTFPVRGAFPGLHRDEDGLGRSQPSG